MKLISNLNFISELAPRSFLLIFQIVPSRWVILWLSHLNLHNIWIKSLVKYKTVFLKAFFLKSIIYNLNIFLIRKFNVAYPFLLKLIRYHSLNFIFKECLGVECIMTQLNI